MGCEILALQVRHGAEEGGNLYLSSARTLFDGLIMDEPKVVETLFANNWPVMM